MIIKRYNCAASEKDCLNEVDLDSERMPRFETPEQAQRWSEKGWKVYEITIEVKEYVSPPAELKISVEDSI